ncbi:hypothetical protein [Paenibacillus aquistagni]|uniref:Uncharacterized protein YdaL n=1 Tax=Paenibacillus aquistagni TaxID=1852522 RepID=A0A1X7LUE9_9BACL|nr:hypothetical protein [Paenibacillus aquistagni]SMG56912.1 Uncharacterized protein YdaL [Paenibacillus aquistagni]
MKAKQGWRKSVLVMMTMLLMLPAPLQAKAKPEPSSLLIVYDSLALGTSREGNVEALQRLLASFQVQVTVESLAAYQPGTLTQYDKLIEIQNRSDMWDTPSEYVKDLEHYQGEMLFIGEKPRDRLSQALGLQLMDKAAAADLSIGPFQENSVQVPYLYTSSLGEDSWYGSLKAHHAEAAYPYGVRVAPYAYVPFLEKDTLSELAISYLLKDWLQPSQPSHYYVVFKEIYPFSDLALLEQLADELFEAGIPFIASIRPVFSNTDYPAMKRYIQALNYVQSRNGTIVVNAPVVASTIQDLDRSLYNLMEHFIDVLAQDGVIALGMGTEMYWTYDAHYADEGMSFFDSAILFPNERLMYKSKSNTSVAFSSSLYSMDPAFLKRYLIDERLLEPLPMDTAFTYDLVQQKEELLSIADRLKSSWITFEDYKNDSHIVSTPAYELKSERGALYRNGERMGIQAGREETSGDYVYKEQEEKSFEQWFTVQNKIFIVIIFITLIVFTGFLIIGYRMYKRKYYK